MSLELPTTYGGEGAREAGFDAVRKAHGADMVQRIKNWPILTENQMKAEGYLDSDEELAAGIEQAKRNVERARSDKDYALDQASKIARDVPHGQWAIVPSISQLRRDWDLDRAYPDPRAAAYLVLVHRWREELRDAWLGRRPPRPGEVGAIPIDEVDVERKRAKATELTRLAAEYEAEKEAAKEAADA